MTQEAKQARLVTGSALDIRREADAQATHGEGSHERTLARTLGAAGQELRELRVGIEAEFTGAARDRLRSGQELPPLRLLRESVEGELRPGVRIRRVGHARDGAANLILLQAALLSHRRGTIARVAAGARSEAWSQSRGKASSGRAQP